MVMARPPASKSKKIRTGNYYLSWSGLMAMTRVQDVSAPKLDDRDQVLVYHVRKTVAETSEPQRTKQLRRMTCQHLAPVIQIVRSHFHAPRLLQKCVR